MVAPYLEKELGVSVVVENKAGGGGLVGMAALRESKPDGYTISSGGIAMTSIQYQKKTDIRLSDYTWIARIYWTPQVLAVPVNSPFKSVKDLMDYAKANPGKLKHGNTGAGSSTHLASEAMAKQFGMKITQVPYRGEGPMVIGIAAGEVDFAFGLMPPFRPFLEDKRIRVLAVADDNRNELYPDVPTMKELGYDVVIPAFEALHAPKNLSAPVLKRLSEAAKKTLTNPELKKKLGEIGLNLAYQPAEEFIPWLQGYDKQTKALMEELGLAVNK
jgi:tripartite-type tricarboxylate transporter receptor subunit TctC